MLKYEQKLLILPFQEEITEVPAGCKTGEVDDTYKRSFIVTDMQSLNSLDNPVSFHRTFCQIFIVFLPDSYPER